MTIQQHASFDSSAAELNATSKLVKAWESKNAKNAAKAGGISMMALSLAACGGSSTTTTTATDTSTDTTTDTTTVVVAPTAKAFTMTTGTNVFTGGDGDDTFAATHLTFNGTDELAGGAGDDTLNIVDTGSANLTLATAKVSAIETVNITNQTGNTEGSGSNETATVTFSDLGVGQTVIVGGVTFTAGASGATAAQVAAAFASPLTAENDGDTIATANTLVVNGGTFTGITAADTVEDSAAAALVDAKLLAGGWTAAAGGDVKTVVFTSATDTTNVTDIDITGTAVTGANQVSTITVTESDAFADGDVITFKIDGVEVSTAGVTDAGGVTLAATAIKNAINAHVGKVIASSSDGVVTVSNDTPIGISTFAGTDTNGEYALALSTSHLAAAEPVIVTADGVAAVVAADFDTTADASKFTGATKMASVNSTGDVVFSNMVSTQSGAVSGNTAITNGNTTFGHKATATSAVIAIEDGTTAGDITLSGAGLTSAAISSTGEKNTVGTINVAGAKTVTIDATTALTATALATSTAASSLTISGAGAVKLGTLDADIDTVSAAGNSGGLTAAIGAATDTVLTGSSGNDKITASTEDTIAATAKLAVNAGEGTDTLVLGDANDVGSAADGARYTGFEALAVSASQDMSLIAGIESVAITGGNIDLSKMDATQLANVSAAATADNLSLALKTATGTSDAATITAASATATTNVSLTELGVDNIETVNVAFTTGTSGTQSALDFAANEGDEVSALNITGSADVKLTVDQHVFNETAVTIDASALTGKFEIADNSGTLKSGSKVIGSAQVDTIAVDDTTGTSYDGRAGKDAFTTAAASISSTGSDDTSLDGGADDDTLNISDANNLTMTDVHFTDVSNFEKLVLAADGNVSVTVGTAFASAFGSAASVTAANIGANHSFDYVGGLYNGDVTMAITTATDGDGTATAEDYNITTGDGADSVTLTASSFVSDADGHGSISISTDAGADTITLKIGTIADTATAQVVSIDAGAGADTIDITKVNGAGSGAEKANAIFTVENGDSTLTGRDTVKGFDESDGTDMSDTIDFTGSAAVTDFTSSTNAGTIKSHSVSTGMVTFDDVENFDTALVISATNLSDVLDYLIANTASLDTAAFAYDSTGNGTADATMIYHNNDIDSLIELSANTGVSALTTSLTTTDGQVQII